MKIRELFSPARPTHCLTRRNPARRASLSLERLGDRILFAADFGCDVVESKATPAVISTESTSTSHSSHTEETSGETQEMSATVGKPKTGSAGDFTRARTEKANKESAKTNQDAGGSGGFPAGEWEPSEATTSPPTLPTKQRIIGDVPQAIVEPVEEHLPPLKLEEVEGLGRLKENLLEDVMAERIPDTERYGKIERDSLMSEHSNPTSLLGEITGDPFAGPNPGQMSRDSVLGYGMAGDASGGNPLTKNHWTNEVVNFVCKIVGNLPPLTSKHPAFRVARFACGAINKMSDLKIPAPKSEENNEATKREDQKDQFNMDGVCLNTLAKYGNTPTECQQNSASAPKPTVKTDEKPAPDEMGLGTPLPENLVREAVAKLYAQYAQQPWVGTAGQPVPDDDGGTPFDFAAASEVFSQLARQNWNPMIVQPGPDGDMEYNYLGMKEVPRNVGAMKMAMAGQPLPEDPDWGVNDGV